MIAGDIKSQIDNISVVVEANATISGLRIPIIPTGQ